MKKFTCAFLSLLLILSLALVPVYAGDATPATVGYSADLVVPKEGLASLTDITAVEGDMPTEVKISNAAGMQKLAKLVNDGNTFQNKTVYLEKDIDMTGVTNWTPIGNNAGTILNNFEALEFRGTFDGQGHSIKNLVVSSAADDVVNVAVFGRLWMATIRNLIIDESCSFTYEGDSVKARTASLAATVFSGGATGRNIIENVRNDATVTASNGFVGGLFATVGASTNTQVSDLGSNYEGITNMITNCTNTGAVTANGVFQQASGWSSDAGSNAAANAGGFIGYSSRGWLTFSHCLNTGSITAVGYAGGFVGNRNLCGDIVKVEFCRNSGHVVGSYAGGLMGYATGGNDHLFDNTNTGRIETNSDTGAADQQYGNIATVTNVSRGRNTEAVNTVKVLGYQKALDVTTEGNATYRSVRLVGVLNPGNAGLSEFDLVGLEITVTYTKDGKTVTKELNGNSTTVYQSLCGMENTEDDPTPLEKAEGEYYFAIVLENIPTAIENVKLHITPYFVEGGESATTVYGFTAHTTVSVAEEPEAN